MNKMIKFVCAALFAAGIGVQDAAADKVASPLGTEYNPWNIGVEPYPESVYAYTNVNGVLIIDAHDSESEMMDFETTGPWGTGIKGANVYALNIGAHAFENCAEMKGILIRGCVEWIGTDAFKGCSGLVTMQCRPEYPPYADDNLLKDCTGLMRIDVADYYEYYDRDLDEYFGQYMNAPGWRNFGKDQPEEARYGGNLDSVCLYIGPIDNRVLIKSVEDEYGQLLLMGEDSGSYSHSARYEAYYLTHVKVLFVVDGEMDGYVLPNGKREMTIDIPLVYSSMSIDNVITRPAAWVDVENALNGKSDGDSRGKLFEYANENGTNVVKLLDNLVVEDEKCGPMTVLAGVDARLDLNGHEISWTSSGHALQVGILNRVARVRDEFTPSVVALMGEESLGLAASSLALADATQSGLLGRRGDPYGQYFDGNLWWDASTAGAVMVGPTGTFVMDGGTIANVGADNAGAVALGCGTFVMNDGLITDTYSYYDYAAVYNVGGRFEMNGGEICNSYGDGWDVSAVYCRSVAGKMRASLGSAVEPAPVIDTAIARMAITDGFLKDPISVQSSIVPKTEELKLSREVVPATASDVEVTISGGYFGERVTLDPAWIAEGYEVFADDTHEGYVKRVMLPPPELAAARAAANGQIESAAGRALTRSAATDRLVAEAKAAVRREQTVDGVQGVLDDYLPKITAQHEADVSGYARRATGVCRIDLRTTRFVGNPCEIEGVTWSAGNWTEGAVAEGTARITQRNIDTDRTMLVKDGLTGTGEGEKTLLVGQNGSHRLYHEADGQTIESFVTFEIEGYPLGWCKTNPWEIGKDDKPSVIAWKEDLYDEWGDWCGTRLSFDGEGEMDQRVFLPWDTTDTDVTEIFVAKGVVLSEGALAGFPNLERIIFEDPEYVLPRTAMNEVHAIYYETGGVPVDRGWAEMYWPRDGVYAVAGKSMLRVPAFYEHGRVFPEGQSDGKLERELYCPSLDTAVVKLGYNEISFCMSTLLADRFGHPDWITLEYDEIDENIGFRVTLGADLNRTITLPDDIGFIVLDLNGYNMNGPSAEMAGEFNGLPALRIVNEGELTDYPTQLYILDTDSDLTPDVIGGKGRDGVPGGWGAPAIWVADDTDSGMRVVIGPNVTVKGGDAGWGLRDPWGEEKSLAGEPGEPWVARESGQVTVEEGGHAITGDAGRGEVAPWAIGRVDFYVYDYDQGTLPRGVSVVNGSIWFWRRDEYDRATFDFSELNARDFRDMTVEFADGDWDVDQFVVPSGSGIFFCSYDNYTTLYGTGRSIFAVRPCESWPVEDVVAAKKGGVLPDTLRQIAADVLPEDLAGNRMVRWTGLSFRGDNGLLKGVGTPASWCGGAISIEEDAFSVSGCEFRDFEAEEFGGAIYALRLTDHSTVMDSTFYDCHVCQQNGMGGAIYASACPMVDANGNLWDGNVRLVLRGCSFEANTATWGGAVCTTRAAVADEAPVTLDVLSTTFYENEAGYAGGAIAAEGRVNVAGLPEERAVKKSAAKSSAKGELDAESLGGHATVRTMNTVFSGNSAVDYGGAIVISSVEDFVPNALCVSNCVRFTSNWAGSSYEFLGEDRHTLNDACGGAIAIMSPGSTFKACLAEFSQNRAESDGAYGYGAYGGAIYAGDDCTSRVERCAFRGNVAQAINASALGGALSFGAGVADVEICYFNGRNETWALPAEDGYIREFYGDAIDFWGTKALVKNCSFRGACHEAVHAYLAELAVTNCVAVGNDNYRDEADDGDIFIEESAYDVAYTAYGRATDENGAIEEPEGTTNLPGQTTDIYAYKGDYPFEEPYDDLLLARVGVDGRCNWPAALGLVQEETDFRGIAYGSKFWGYSMGAFECPTIRAVPQIVIDPDEYAYTGLPIEPHKGVTAHDEFLNTNLVEGVDYVLTWENNVEPTDRAVITAHGIGDWYAEASTNFWITAYYVNYWVNDELLRPADAFGTLSGSNVTARILELKGLALDWQNSVTNGVARRYSSKVFCGNNLLYLDLYYYTDENDDDVPDIYQRALKYKVVNGYWNNEYNGADKKVFVTLYKEDGKTWDPNGLGLLGDGDIAIPTAGNSPFAGYRKAGQWYPVAPRADLPVTRREPNLPIMLFVYGPDSQGSGGTGGRGGRGGREPATVADPRPYGIGTISKFAAPGAEGENASGVAEYSIVDETTGQELAKDVLAGTEVEVMGATSLENGRDGFKSVSRQVTGPNGEWTGDGKYQFFYLRQTE